MVVYNLNGIASEAPPKEGYWFHKANGDVFFSEMELMYEIEKASVSLHELIIEKVFGDKIVPEVNETRNIKRLTSPVR